MKLLVTGASGLLGTRLCELAINNNYQVHSAYRQHMPSFGTPLRLDITCNKALEGVFRKIKPEVVVHAAAISDVDKCEKEKDLAWKTNAEATSHIAELSRKHGSFLVYVSTDYVFNGKRGMYKETDRPEPINHYGITKLKGEEAVKESKAQYCIARTSVVYGAIPAAGKVNFALWLLERLKRNEKTNIVTDQSNSPTLNTNLAEMILEILERRNDGTFHLAGATRMCRYDFARLIAETFNLDPRSILPTISSAIPWNARRPSDSSLNVDKAKQTLTNKPMAINEALDTLKKEMT